MARPRIVVTRRLPNEVEAELAKLFDVSFNRADVQFGHDALQQALSDADGIACTVTDRLTAEVLAAYPLRTRILANFGVGLDHVDLEAARAHDITVTNTPDVLTDDTADIAINLMLTAMRRTGEGERLVRSGQWQGWAPTHMMGRMVSNATLGIVGLGRIGMATARRAHRGFGMRILGWSRTRPSDEVLQRNGIEWCDQLDALLAESDVISLHVPGGQGTEGMIGARQLAMMKEGASLINTARGNVVDIDALVASLLAGHLGSAGLDVHPREPLVDRRLLGMEQVVLLPHLGSATIQTRHAIGMKVIANLTAFFEGTVPPDLVVGPAAPTTETEPRQ